MGPAPKIRVWLNCCACGVPFLVLPSRSLVALYCSRTCCLSAQAAARAASITTAAHLCECGCGGATRPTRRGNMKRGLAYGQHPRYLKGHHADARIPLDDRFWSRVAKSEGCWEWTGAVSNQGYGLLYLSKVNGACKYALAHRLSYELAHGLCPNDRCVCHHCDNPRCVRPDHLFLGTKMDNTRDMMAKRRHRTPRKLTVQQVSDIRARAHAREVHRTIAADYGISRSTVGGIANGRTWAHVPLGTQNTRAHTGQR